MTPEQQREQILKRALPALGILVLYFAFGSGFVTDKTKKAHDQFVSMSQKGIDEAILPGIEQEKIRVQAELAEKQTEKTKLSKTIEENSGFLARGKSINETAEKVSVILSNHNLQVLDEKRSDKVEVMPKALRDIQKWLKDSLAGDAKPAVPVPVQSVNAKTDEMNIWSIHFLGAYLDCYSALKMLANSDIKALPISLTMQAVKSNVPNTASHVGKQEWVLTLLLN